MHPTSVWVPRIAVHSSGGSLLSDENPAKQTLGMLTFLYFTTTLNMVDLSRICNGSGTSLRMPDKIKKIEFKLESLKRKLDDPLSTLVDLTGVRRPRLILFQINLVRLSSSQVILD
ncbi:hypothetical protein D5086_005789 [Populus alba]|uniref:Uncharacterized protein n=1 Tax=Populus alba TaxID=43335 RepID=A0ACC4CU83_POPAL